MASVTSSTGIFSGIDTASIISKLMAVEQQPLQALSTQKAGYQAALSAFGQLKSSLSKLSTASQALKNVTAQTMTATSSNTSVFTASADSTAVAGTYSIQVNHLAAAQSLYSSTFATETSAVADLSTYSTQKLKIQVGNGTAQEITIDSSNNTLAGIRDAINAAGVGVKASTINSGFEITAGNNTIAFNDGSNRTATLAAGTYSADGLAAEIKRALEEANGGSDTYTVAYDSASNTFSISNDASNANSLDILWEDPSTTAAGVLGFSATDHASMAAGDSSTGDTAVGGYRLILNSESTGSANHIKISVDEDNNGTYAEAGSETDTTGLSQLAFDASYDSSGNVSGGTANLTQTSAALSASLVVNGLNVSRDSNTITDLISGVTLNLVGSSSDLSTTPSLTVANDTQGITGKVSDFVSAYNSSMTYIKSIVSDSPTARALLSGDGVVNGLLDTLRSSISKAFGSYSPAVLGITHDQNGNLQLDTGMLNTALTSDLSGVVSSLNKIGTSFDDTTTTFINTSIPARTDGLNQSIQRVDDKSADLQNRLTLMQQQLTKRFNDMETLIGQLQQNGNALTQMVQGISSSSSTGK